jgi:hypothetical protein
LKGMGETSMPRKTPTIQRVPPANVQPRPVTTQVRAAKFQPPRAAAPRANLSSVGTTVGRAPAPTNTLAPPPAAVSAATCNCSVCTSLQCLERTRFFAGQLLTDADLTNEQNYLLAKNRLHNRYLHGWGVVCGLQLTCSECEGWVTVNPGYAIDPCGNDIIVCAAQSFNVLQAIQACSTPASTAANCTPLRYRPAPNCTDAIQKWCVTVQYQEQATQMVTPLQQTSSSSSGCGCGSGGGCSCGCSGCGSTKSNGNGCGCGSSMSSSSVMTGSSTAACEPTRIIEGFQFGVCALPAASSGPQPGTLVYQVEQCVTSLVQLAEQVPVLQSTAGETTLQNAQQWYQSVTNYLFAVQQYFAQSQVLTYCKALNALNNITVPQATPNSVITDYQTIEAEILIVIVVAIFDCVCVALLPQCPPNPCDNRVPLACVSVQNGAIISICHFECRQQLIGFPALQYWLQPLFTALGQVVTGAFEKYCCPGTTQKDPARFVNSATAFASANFTTAGFTNAAMLNRTLNSYVAQKMGASLVNTVNPGLNAVDLRPFVGQPLQTLKDSLASQYNKARTAVTIQPVDSLLDVQAVDSDPAWDLTATSAGAQLAPAAVSAGQPLTVYVKGQSQSIVAIEVTDPTRALQLQVQNLTTTVAALQTQLANTQTQTPKSKGSSKTE